MITKVIEGTVYETAIEDGGCALITEVMSGDASDCFFVRLHSWDRKKKHPEHKALGLTKGRRIRIEITVDS
jgi:hypothetical protein